MIEYRMLGGNLDLYFIEGPSPIEAIQNYGTLSYRSFRMPFLKTIFTVELIGLPQMPPLWSLGFHLYFLMLFQSLADNLTLDIAVSGATKAWMPFETWFEG